MYLDILFWWRQVLVIDPFNIYVGRLFLMVLDDHYFPFILLLLMILLLLIRIYVKRGEWYSLIYIYTWVVGDST